MLKFQLNFVRKESFRGTQCLNVTWRTPKPQAECINTLRPRWNGRHFADDIFRCIFLNENIWFPIKISVKFVPEDPIYNIPSLIRIMAWRRPGDKPLSEPMMVSLPTHLCVARSQWVNWITHGLLICASKLGTNILRFCSILLGTCGKNISPTYCVVCFLNVRQ